MLRVSAGAALLVSLGALAACTSTSSSSSDAGSPFASKLCVDPSTLADGTYRPKSFPDAGALRNHQHVSVGACRADIFYYANDAETFTRAVVTNCGPTQFGGSSAARGFPADCLLESEASGADKVAITTNCVCCADGQCGEYCHPVALNDAGAGLICADYNYDFKSATIQDPRESPGACDCSGW